LNNSSLENIIIINLDGYEVILVELKEQMDLRNMLELSIQMLATQTSSQLEY
jgi:hypothetical protein